MFRRNYISFCVVSALFCVVLAPMGSATADVVVPDNLEIGSLKFSDGTSQNSASGVTKVWSGVANTHVSGMSGGGAYQYLVSSSGTPGICTIYFNYADQVCVVSSQSDDKRCAVVSHPATNASTINCRRHSDNALSDSEFAFICLAP